MKTINNIIVNLKVIFTNYGFYICIIFTLILCLSTGIYFDDVTNNEYSVIRSLITFDKEFMLGNIDFCSMNIVIKGSGSWLSMFIPIISSFSFIPFICDESESKAKRNIIFRSSKLSFHSSRFISACVSGGIAVMLGYILFTVLSYIVFPNFNEYSSEMQDMYKDTLKYLYPKSPEYGMMYILILKYAEMFIFGFFSVVPAITLTAVSKNKYVVLCIPFFLKYSITQSCLKLSAKAYVDQENIDEKLIKLVCIISPDSILELFESEYQKWIIVYNISIVVVLFFVYMIIQNRRFDFGE